MLIVYHVTGLNYEFVNPFKLLHQCRMIDFSGPITQGFNDFGREDSLDFTKNLSTVIWQPF